MDEQTVRQEVVAAIRQIAEINDLELDEIKDEDALVEGLGFASLEVASLIARLEISLGIDPFASNMAVITEIRTVGEICNLYVSCLEALEG